MPTPIRILLVEDSESDALLVLRQLERDGFEVTHLRIETASEMKSALEKETWDVVLSDYKLPSFFAPAALKLLNEKGLNIPFIVISGFIGEDSAVELMRSGAKDFVRKDNLPRLAPVIRRELEALENLNKTEEKYAQIFNVTPVAVMITRLKDGRFIDVNEKAIEMIGLKKADIIGKTSVELELYSDPEDRRKIVEQLKKRGAASGVDVKHKNSRGKEFLLRQNYKVVELEGEQCVLTISEDMTDKLNVEHKLRESEEKYRFLVDHIREIAIILDKTGKIMFANRSSIKSLGYSEDEIIGKSIAGFLTKGSLVKAMWAVSQEFLGIHNGEFEVEVKNKKGEIRSLEIAGESKAIEKDGKKIGILVNGRDITEKKKAEREIVHLNIDLQQRNKWLKEINEMSSGINALLPGEDSRGFIMKKLTARPELGVVLFSNYDSEKCTLIPSHYELKQADIFDKIVKLLGARPEEIVSQVSKEQFDIITKQKVVKHNSLTDLSFGQIPAIVNAGIKQLLGLDHFITLTCFNEKELFGYVILGVKAGAAELSAEFLEALANIIAVSLRREKAQKDIVENETRLRRAEQIGKTGSWEYDILANKLTWSEQIFRIYERDKELGAPTFDTETTYYSEEDKSTLKKIITLAKTTGQENDCEYTIKLASGKNKIARLIIVPVKDNKGKVVKLNGIVQDITDKRKIEEQMVQSRKMDAVGTLTGGIAHDFNNMLGIIIGYSDISIRQLPVESGILDNIKEIKKTAQRAAALTAQLLAFSRKETVAQKAISLNDLLNDIKKMLSRIIGEDIEILMELQEDLMDIFADNGQLDQVIINLATNAMHAMPRGGKLKITTKNIFLDEQAAKNIPYSRPGRFVCLTVSDTGTGMSQEQLQHIFEPFYTTKPFGKGSGLGLSVIYGIVKQHEAWINFKSEQGKGTEINIYFPALEKRKENVKNKEKLNVDPAFGTGEKILVVEDEEIIREMVSGLLKEQKYTVFKAANAAEALVIFEEQKYKIDLLFSDSVMPGIRGLELARQLKAKNAKIKVIISSGYLDDKSDIMEVKKEGYGFLTKPYEIQDLFSKVAEVLGKQN